VRNSSAVLVVALFANPFAVTAATITVGDHVLIPNLASQPISILVTGGDAVSGLNLSAQIGDGGPELVDFGLPAGVDAPSIRSVDLKNGTIFASASDPQVDLGSIPQVANWSIAMTEPEANVPASGLLATLWIDTTDFFEGTWSLLLSDVLPDLPGGPFATDFAGVPAVIQNGSITVDPNLAGSLGDTNGDGRVDIDDLNDVRNHFGAMGPADGTLTGDAFPFDGLVNIDDLDAVRNNFGAGTSPVPEPSALLLAVTAIGIGWTNSRHRWPKPAFATRSQDCPAERTGFQATVR